MPLMRNMQNSKKNESRKHKRYKVKSGIFAVLGYECSKLGQVIDISMGGLSFSYAGAKSRPVDSTDMIFLFDKKDSDVNNLSYKFNTRIVSENKFSEDNAENPVNQKIRCALQFNDLPYHQEKWVETFLRNHTIEENL
jgi:hypothetical protein